VQVSCDLTAAGHVLCFWFGGIPWLLFSGGKYAGEAVLVWGFEVFWLFWFFVW